MLRKLILLVLVAVAAGVLMLAWREYAQWHEAPLPLAERVVFEVPQGEPLSRLAARLEGDGIIEHAWQLRLLARLRDQSAAVRAGEYELAPGTTLAGLLDMLVAGRVKLHDITIVEGTTAKQLFEQLSRHPAIRRTLETIDHATVAEVLGLENGHAEGWFLPETYRFPRGTTDVEFLRRAHEDMKRELEAAWQARADGLPLKNPYEALILASIIEKETSLEHERGTIAGVFTRRLQRGMRLQTDPTVIYGLGDAYTGDIRYRDLRTDTPYNTYTRKGLPPTPIALPGRASLRAAVNPEPGDALYFVAISPRGEHKFSATYEEHRAAVRKYQSMRRPLDPPAQDATE